MDVNLEIKSHEITRVMKRVGRGAPSLKHRRPNSIVRGSSVFESVITDSAESEDSPERIENSEL